MTCSKLQAPGAPPARVVNVTTRMHRLASVPRQDAQLGRRFPLRTPLAKQRMLVECHFAASLYQYSRYAHAAVQNERWLWCVCSRCNMCMRSQSGHHAWISACVRICRCTPYREHVLILEPANTSIYQVALTLELQRRLNAARPAPTSSALRRTRVRCGQTSHARCRRRCGRCTKGCCRASYQPRRQVGLCFSYPLASSSCVQPTTCGFACATAILHAATPVQSSR